MAEIVPQDINTIVGNKKDIDSVRSRQRLLNLYFLFTFALGILLTFVEKGTPATIQTLLFIFIPSAVGSACGAMIIPFIIKVIHKFTTKKKITKEIIILFYIITGVEFIFVIINALSMRLHQ